MCQLDKSQLDTRVQLTMCRVDSKLRKLDMIPETCNDS